MWFQSRRWNLAITEETNQSKKEEREKVERGRERASEREGERGSGDGERVEGERENLKIVRFTQLQLFLEREKNSPIFGKPLH